MSVAGCDFFSSEIRKAHKYMQSEFDMRYVEVIGVLEMIHAEIMEEWRESSCSDDDEDEDGEEDELVDFSV